MRFIDCFVVFKVVFSNEFFYFYDMIMCMLFVCIVFYIFVFLYMFVLLYLFVLWELMLCGLFFKIVSGLFEVEVVFFVSVIGIKFDIDESRLCFLFE